ncbi:MAG: transglutaminase family protein, partial [Verrucomicrobiota bacterium]
HGLHLGFYPTAGQLRLTSFDGDDIFNWRILGTVPSAAYKPGDWNLLRVRVQPGRITCSVNGSVVFDVRDVAPHGHRVGLAKFRGTVAQFRNFAVTPIGTDGPGEIPPSLLMALGGADVPTARVGDGEREALRGHLPAARSFLEGRARQLEAEAARLRDLSSRLHREQAAADLVRELDQPDAQIDLARAALLVARHDDPDVDVAAAQADLQALAAEASTRFKDGSDDTARLDVLRTFLFEENGFHGSRHDYQNRANSHLHAVLADREGLPITLAIVLMDVARRAGVPNVRGWPLPGHFLVAHEPKDGPRRLIDVFHGGRILTHSEASDLGSEFAGVPVRADLMQAATPREIIVRLVNNLLAFSERQESAAAALPYADLMVAIAANPRTQAAQRIDRARLRAEAGDLAGAREDLRWILEAKPEGTDLDRVGDLLRRLEGAR